MGLVENIGERHGDLTGAEDSVSDASQATGSCCPCGAGLGIDNPANRDAEGQVVFNSVRNTGERIAGRKNFDAEDGVSNDYLLKFERGLRAGRRHETGVRC